MPEQFNPTRAQSETLAILVDLIGLSGVCKRPEQGECVVLDLLPGAHTLFGQPFCVRIDPDGRMERITDEEAGIDERPSPMEALEASSREMLARFRAEYEGGSGAKESHDPS